MAGVGQTGVWRTGVWVEPLDFEGDFALSASGVLIYTGRFSFAGIFDLEANALLSFDGDQLYRSQFGIDANADTAFDGEFTAKPGQGVFSVEATAHLRFAWVPEITGPGDAIPGTPPADAVPKLKPGDVFILNGTAGICGLDSQGRLVVKDDKGQVMCIIGPAGVEPL